MRSLKRTGLASAAVLLAASAALAGCAEDEEGGTTEVSGTSPGEGKAGCEQLTQFGDLSDREVTVYTSIVAPEDQPHIDSYELFTECTGADVKYEGSKEFETQLQVRVQAGNPPDIAFIPQPGLLETLVGTDQVVAAPASVSDNVDEFFGEDWKTYGTVEETFYAAPLGGNVKSFVWYSPAMFEENGWEIPTTWEEMMTLSQEIADQGDVRPWCAGIESGEATGWPGTDWLEDVMLRTSGPDVYDQWVNHEIPFDDPAVVEALDTAGEVLKNEELVNGGIGDVKSIATTAFQEGGLPILDEECAMHRMASFYAANWPEGTEIAEDGDVFAFYLPAVSEEFGTPVLGGGEFVAAFSDEPEVQALQTYLSSDTWANEKAKATPGGGWVSANTGLDVANLSSPIDRLSAEIFQDPDAVFRFDGSDQMPGAVGVGSFFTEMTAWIAQDQSSKDTLANIESSWEE